MAKRPSASHSQSADDRILVLVGKEPFLRTRYAERAIEVLKEAGHDAETFRFDGSTAIAEVLDECRSFGLMQSHKVVIVDGADQLVAGANRPLMERYAASPVESATLILRCDSWNKGKKLDDAIRAVGGFLACDAPSDADAARWCARRAKEIHGVELSRDAAFTLIARVGPELARLATELEKLATAAGEGGITPDLVRELVGATREEDVWPVQEVLLRGRPEEAVAYIRSLLGASGASAVPVRFAFADLAKKIHSAAHGGSSWGPGAQAVSAAGRRIGGGRAAELLSAAIEADVKGKTGGGDEVVGLETLAVRFAQALGN